eukprot:COSAG01_NODE_1237_length_11098_cov_7.982726_11_plen_87_part_00
MTSDITCRAAACLHHDEHRHGVGLVTRRRVTDMDVPKKCDGRGRVRVVPWQSHRHEHWLQKASYRMNDRKEFDVHVLFATLPGALR